MAGGDPIKRTFCIVCGKPNPVGAEKCKDSNCGGACEARIIGYTKDDKEAQSEVVPPPKRSPDSVLPF